MEVEAEEVVVVVMEAVVVAMEVAVMEVVAMEVVAMEVVTEVEEVVMAGMEDVGVEAVFTDTVAVVWVDTEVTTETVRMTSTQFCWTRDQTITG